MPKPTPKSLNAAHGIAYSAIVDAMHKGGFTKYAKGTNSEVNSPDAYGLEYTDAAVECLEAAFPEIAQAPVKPPKRKAPVIFKNKMQCWAPDELAVAFRDARKELCQDQSTALRVAMSLYIHQTKIKSAVGSDTTNDG